ncbi:MAG TPA: ABC transporter substrate-binding protein [Stellaceae bacterium]|nr:ABC transporter substrate-binding protein [Stellaceae bacterium]
MRNGIAGVLVLGLVLWGAAAHAQSGTLTLYTSQPDRIATQTVAAFRERYPAIRVDVYRSGTTEVMNKLAAEFLAGDPKPDVLFIADAVTMEGLKAEGRLLPFPEADLSAFPAAAYDKDKTYFGSKLITTGIVYNTAAKRPASWLDLLAADARGQVVLPSPLYSGAAVIHMAAIDSDPALGSDYYAKLAANGAIAVQGNGGVVTQVAGGQKMYGMLVDFMALNARAKGSPVDFVFPREGVSAVTEPVAILKTAPNPAAAKAFVAFILSKAGQELAVRQGFLPARLDVEPPSGFPKPADLHILPLDMGRTVQETSELKAQFSKLFGG